MQQPVLIPNIKTHQGDNDSLILWDMVLRDSWAVEGEKSPEAIAVSGEHSVVEVSGRIWEEMQEGGGKPE